MSPPGSMAHKGVFAMAGVAALCVVMVWATYALLLGGEPHGHPSQQRESETAYQVTSASSVVGLDEEAQERRRLQSACTRVPLPVDDPRGASFYTELRHTCMSDPFGKKGEQPPSVQRSETVHTEKQYVFHSYREAGSGGCGQEDLPPFRAFSGSWTQFLYWFPRIKLHNAPLPRYARPGSQCFVPGLTLLLEQGWAYPRHLAHSAEYLFKMTAIIEDLRSRANGTGSTAGVVPDRTLLLRYGDTEVSDWQRSQLRAAIAMGTRKQAAPEGRARVGLGPHDDSPELVRWSAAQVLHLMQQHGCPQVCFEHAVAAAPTHEFAVSTRNADFVRDWGYRYCGVDPVVTEDLPTRFPSAVVIARTSNRKRAIDNLDQVVEAVKQAGFSPVKLIQPMPFGFCETVRTMASADLVVVKYGSESTNLAWMRPGAVIVEVFPLYWHHPCYKTEAKHARVNYLSWQNTHRELHLHRPEVGSKWDHITSLEQCAANWPGCVMDHMNSQTTVHLAEFGKVLAKARAVFAEGTKFLESDECMQLKPVTPFLPKDDGRKRKSELQFKRCPPIESYAAPGPIADPAAAAGCTSFPCSPGGTKEQ